MLLTSILTAALADTLGQLYKGLTLPISKPTQLQLGLTWPSWRPGLFISVAAELAELEASLVHQHFHSSYS